MSSIPLVALNVKPQGNSPLETYAQMMQLQGMKQQRAMHQEQLQGARMENQQRQQQMQDQQTVMQVLGQTGGDMDKALPMLSGKVSPQTLMGLQKAHLETRKTLAEISDKELAAKKYQNDQYVQLLSDAKSLPPEQYQSAWPQIASAANQIKPEHPLDPAQPIPQQNLNTIGLGLMTSEQYYKAEENRRAQATLAETQRHNMESEKIQRENVPVDKLEMRDWLGKNPGKGPSDYAIWKAKNSPSAMLMGGVNLTPEAVAMAGQLYAQTGQLPGGLTRSPQTTANILNSAAAGTPDVAANKIAFQGKKSTTTYFTSGAGGKQLTAFNTAVSHLDTLDHLASDLKNTNLQVFNKAAQTFSEQTGNPAPASFEAAKNAMSGEVAAALKASGATDQEISHISATFNRAQSPAQLKGAIGTYRELLKSKAVQLKKQYEAGMRGQPAFEQPTQPTTNNGGFDWNSHPKVK